MNTGFKIKATLFIVLFLLLVAVIVFILKDSSPIASVLPAAAPSSAAADRSAQTAPITTRAPATPVPATVPPQAQTQTPSPATEAVIYFTPAPTPVATPAPVSTPVPTLPPQPAGMVLGSGTFRSDTGSLLNIHADWTAAVADETQIRITVTVYVDHYQLHNTGSRSLFITLGNDTRALDTADITYDVAGAPTSSVLGATEFTVPLARNSSAAQELHVKWNFGGVYGDGRGNKVDLSTVTCGGSFTVSR